MRITGSPMPGQDLRIQHWDTKGTLLIDMSWEDWDEMKADVEYFRQHGRSRPESQKRISPKSGLDLDGKGLWIPTPS